MLDGRCCRFFEIPLFVLEENLSTESRILGSICPQGLDDLGLSSFCSFRHAMACDSIHGKLVEIPGKWCFD